MRIGTLIMAVGLASALLAGSVLVGGTGAQALAVPQIEDPAPDTPEGDVPGAPEAWRGRGACPCGHECRQGPGGPGTGYGGRGGKQGRVGRMEHWGGRRGPAAGGGLAAQGLLRHARALDLSREQVKKLQDMADETRKTLIGLRAEVQKERISMRSELRSGRDDLARLKRHLGAISSKKAEMQEVRLTHLLEAKRVLNDEQRKKLGDEFPGLGRWAD